MLEYALAHPDRVKALVLSSTSGTIDRRGADPSGGTQLRRVADATAEAKVAAGLRDGIHPAMGERAAERFPALHLLYRQHRRDGGHARQGEAARRPAPHGDAHARPSSTTFRVPTLLIAGGEDVVFPPFLASAIAASLPCGEAQMIADAGHSPYFEQAATFNALVEAFLARQR